MVATSPNLAICKNRSTLIVNPWPVSNELQHVARLASTFFYLVSLRLSDQPLFPFPSVLFLSVLIASQTQFAPIVTGAFSLSLPPLFSLLSLLTLLKHCSCSFGVWLVRSGFLVSRWNFPCRVELGDSLRPAITSRLESFIGECFPINYVPHRIDDRCCSIGYKFPWKLRVHFPVQFIVSLLRSSTIKHIGRLS